MFIRGLFDYVLFFSVHFLVRKKALYTDEGNLLVAFVRKYGVFTDGMHGDLSVPIQSMAPVLRFSYKRFLYQAIPDPDQDCR